MYILNTLPYPQPIGRAHPIYTLSLFVTVMSADIIIMYVLLSFSSNFKEEFDVYPISSLGLSGAGKSSVSFSPHNVTLLPTQLSVTVHQ